MNEVTDILSEAVAAYQTHMASNPSVKQTADLTADDYYALYDNCFCAEETRSLLLSSAYDDVDTYRDSEGRTALMLSIYADFSQSVSLLLRAGASPSIKDNRGRTALMFACFGHHYEAAQLMMSGATVNEYINSQDDHGNTALMWAITNQKEDVASLLIRSGADVNIRDDENSTVLMEAAGFASPDIISLLLTAGAELNARDNDGCTALMKAAKVGNDEVMSVLQSSGADPNMQDSRGWTAADLLEMAHNPTELTIDWSHLPKPH